MAKYIFLDNWVFDLLRRPRFEAGLVQMIESSGFTVLITSLSMVELYNPGWQGAAAADNERGAVAARFLARVPCVIANPGRIWEMEVAEHLVPLPTLPFALDLADLPEKHREAALLGLLRRHDLFLQQGKDIEAWRLEHEQSKNGWLQNVEEIIEAACANGYLDKAAHPKRSGSDLADHMQISLLPYCSAFTADRTMANMLRRMREDVVSVSCDLWKQSDIEEQLRQYR
jgi:hypothetical protein